MEIRFVKPGRSTAALQEMYRQHFRLKHRRHCLIICRGSWYIQLRDGTWDVLMRTERMIGSLLMMDFEMNVRGKMMKMGAPAYVSTSFLHKKEHVAKNLLRVQMGVFAQTEQR